MDDYQYYDYVEDVDDMDEHYQDHESIGHAEQHAYNVNMPDRMWDSYENCVLPSLTQVFSYIAPLLFGCFLCRLICGFYARRYRLTGNWQESNSLTLVPMHLINAVCGLIMLYAVLGQRVLVLLLLSSISYGLLQLARLGKGQQGAVAIAALSVGSQLFYELAIWQKRDDWPQLRGMQMVTNMKVISLGYDLRASDAPMLRMPNIAAYLGYIYNPASCVLGPWLSYSRYLDSLCHKPNWRRSICHMLLNVVICLLSLTISNCVAPALGELNVHGTKDNGGLGHWVLMYTGALSVRSSHYFVSFLSQALLSVSGQQLDATQHGSNSKLLGDLVSRPWHIELPRSLSALVRSWNVPMHEWLKRYVYGNSKQRSRHNTILAVFCTYMVSALLHGMDFRIYLVLLSLATFAQGETMLRRHLATLCDACVTVNPCPGAERCRYTHCPRRGGWCKLSSWLVTIANLAFTLLAMLHLAYLGIVLLNETLTLETENELPFMYHWATAGYLSHYIGIGMFVLYLIIS